MNSSHSSELALLAAVLVLLAGAAVAGAVTVDSATAPEESAVGEEVTVEVELTDLYAESSEWELDGTTELESAQWSLEYYRDGEQIASGNPDGQSLGEAPVQEGDDQYGPDQIVVAVTGETPALDAYAYGEAHQFLGMELTRDGTAVDSWSVESYVDGDPGSREARTALDDARDAIDRASEDGTDVATAESTWEDAVAAYDAGDYGEAVSLAGDAESELPSDGSDASDGADGTADGDGTTDGDTAGGDGATDGDSAADGDGTADGDDSSDGDTTDSDESDDGGVGALTLFFYALGIAVLVGVVGGALYLHQQRQGPGRDPLG